MRRVSHRWQPQQIQQGSLTVSSWVLPPVCFTFYCRAASPDHLSTRSLSCRLRDHSDFVFMRRPIPARAPSRAQANHFPAVVGLHLSCSFPENNVRYDRGLSTLMLTAALPIPQLMHRIIGCRPAPIPTAWRKPRHMRRYPCHIAARPPCHGPQHPNRNLKNEAGTEFGV